ncbi:MAG: HD domain-containing protein [Candidatus Moranbacteria bacterium]|nr:HD domain-containing protein [Candidatus Moranbacteria bacterium]
MGKKEIIKKIEIEAKKFFVGASGCHDWTHVERVRVLAMRIGKKEKADLFVLETAALLHDIGRKEELKAQGSFCHAERGAEIAKVILKKYEFNQEQIDNIFHCIQSHRYRNSYVPTTLEAKVLFDADKLDSTGAVGIGRLFLFAGSSHGSGRLHSGNEKKLAKTKKDYSFTVEDTAAMEYYTKIKNIEKRVLTKSGKKVAHERQKFAADFFRRLEKEVEGII